jgi:hypothetical protein
MAAADDTFRDQYDSLLTLIPKNLKKVHFSAQGN